MKLPGFESIFKRPIHEEKPVVAAPSRESVARYTEVSRQIAVLAQEGDIQGLRALKDAIRVDGTLTDSQKEGFLGGEGSPGRIDNEIAAVEARGGEPVVREERRTPTLTEKLLMIDASCSEDGRTKEARVRASEEIVRLISPLVAEATDADGVYEIIDQVGLRLDGVFQGRGARFNAMLTEEAKHALRTLFREKLKGYFNKGYQIDIIGGMRLVLGVEPMNMASPDMFLTDPSIHKPIVMAPESLPGSSNLLQASRQVFSPFSGRMVNPGTESQEHESNAK